MNKMVVGISILIVALCCVCWETAGCQQARSHAKSDIWGLEREITLYSNDGKVINQWTTKSQVEDRGGSFRFLVDGKAIHIAGTVTLIEK